MRGREGEIDKEKIYSLKHEKTIETGHSSKEQDIFDGSQQL
jgi:hypothetical protein